MVNYLFFIEGKEIQWLFFNCVEFFSFQCGCKVLIIGQNFRRDQQIRGWKEGGMCLRRGQGEGLRIYDVGKFWVQFQRIWLYFSLIFNIFCKFGSSRIFLRFVFISCFIVQQRGLNEIWVVNIFGKQKVIGIIVVYYLLLLILLVFNFVQISFKQVIQNYFSCVLGVSFINFFL